MHTPRVWNMVNPMSTIAQPGLALTSSSSDMVHRHLNEHSRRQNPSLYHQIADFIQSVAEAVSQF